MTSVIAGAARTGAEISAELAAARDLIEFLRSLPGHSRVADNVQGFAEVLAWAVGDQKLSPVRGARLEGRPVDVALEWTAAMRETDKDDARSLGVARGLSWLRRI